MAISHSPAPSVPTNWSGGLRALLVACVMAGLWLNYGTTPALFAAVGVALYAAMGPFQLGGLIFSRRTATLSLQWGVYLAAAIILINVVGFATDSPNVVFASLANLAFICGLLVVGVVVLRAIGRSIIGASAKVPALWSSAVANLKSQIALLQLYSRLSSNLGSETQPQASPNVDPGNIASSSPHGA